MEESRHSIVGQACSPTAASIALALPGSREGVGECSPRQRLIRSEAARRPLARREPPIPDVAKQALQLEAGGGLGDTVDSNVLKLTTKSHWFLTFPFTLDSDCFAQSNSS